MSYNVISNIISAIVLVIIIGIAIYIFTFLNKSPERPQLKRVKKVITIENNEIKKQ